MKSIAENMKDILIENHQKSVWYGNMSIIEECAKRSNLSNRHPMKLITDILNALDRSKLFQKVISWLIFRKKRKYRCFTLSK